MRRTSLKPLRKHLLKEQKNGAPTAILLAQFALFIATSLFFPKTTFSSKHDKRGIKTALFYHIIALLLPYSQCLNQLKFFRQRTCGYKVNTVANLTCLVLAILFEKIYEKSLAILGVALSTAVLCIALLVIIQPRSDLGILGFLLGVSGSVSYNIFGLTFKTWVVVAIGFVLFGFKSWLDQNWLDQDVHENQLLLLPFTISNTHSELNKTISKSNIIQTLSVPVFYLYWDQYLLRNNCTFSSFSCNSSSVVELTTCVIIFCLWIVFRFFHHTPAEDLHMKLLYLEKRAAFARLFFPSEAKLAMDIASAQTTSEFASLSAPKEVDLNETPIMQNKRLRSMMETLMKTVEMGWRYFPHCSQVLDRYMADGLEEMFFLETGTPEEEQEMKRDRFMEVKVDIQKAFNKDKHLHAMLPVTSSESFKQNTV